MKLAKSHALTAILEKLWKFEKILERVQEVILDEKHHILMAFIESNSPQALAIWENSPKSLRSNYGWNFSYINGIPGMKLSK